MKTYFLPLFMIVLLVSTACDSEDNGPRVSGSGNVIKEDRTLDDIDRITVQGSANVVLRQETTQSVSVEADDNIVPIITTEVRGGELFISNSQSYRTRNAVTVYVAIPSVRSLRVQGSADIVSETSLEGSTLEMSASGSGDIRSEVYYDELTANISGSGNVALLGEVTEQDVSIIGSGSYQARDLTSETCRIRVAGSGDAAVQVRQQLDVTVSGSGNVVYYGDPQVGSSITGSGDVTRGG